MVLAVAAAAALGATCRWQVDLRVRRRAGPDTTAGTLAVNLSGSLVLGFLAGLGLHHGAPGSVLTVVGTGFVGAYTTFSAFALARALTSRQCRRAGDRKAA